MIDRRALLTGLAAAGAGCERTVTPVTEDRGGQRFNWKMVTTWPPNFPGLGTGANTLARYLEEASGGRLRVQVYAAGELVPAFEVFDAVASGAAELGHGGAYYWRGKAEAVQFFSTVPFGLNTHEMNAWLYYGGGLELWREVYEPFGLLPFPAGNSGVQMGGWFNRPIESMEDLRGLKMRIQGIGGEVLRLAGGTPVSLPGAELFTALQTGSIDATEWVGPYNDVAFGLHQVARYYYYPGWHEPGPTMECIVNAEAYARLPEHLQAAVRIACNSTALEQLRGDASVEIRAFPEPVLAGLRALTERFIEELTARDTLSAKIWASYRRFLHQARGWQQVSERAELSTSAL
jgi:TRAP-type mannitol/chloroaromatic compound transport system substrate-binding protein